MGRVLVTAAFAAAMMGAAARGDDLDTVATRIRVDAYSSALSATTTTGYLNSLGADGRWADVNYADTSRTNWGPNTHLTRMHFMAQAYANPSHSLYQSPTLLAGVRKAYDAFVTLDPRSTNWWYNEIWTPQVIGKTVLLVQPQLTAAQITSGTAIIARSYIPRSTNAGTNTGENRQWRALATVLRGVITRDGPLTSEAFGAISDTFVVTTGEGIQPDGGFHQHGPQLNNGSYGLSFSQDAADLSSYAVGTTYAMPAGSANVLADYLLDGQQWMLRGVSFEPTAQGRGISRSSSRNLGNGMASVIDQTMTLTGTYRAAELTAMRNRLGAAQVSGTASPALALVGHKHFWRSDYTAHHRPGFSATVKVSSTRTLEPETGNGEGLRNLHLADGVNLIQQRGDEYTSIQPIWDWRRLPGTTIEQGTYSLKPSVDWGVEGATGFAGGVSDGRNGATVLDYSRLNVKAHKAWFFFDDVQVALGAGIDAAAATSPVITTLNQAFQKGSVSWGTTSGSTGTLTSGTQAWSDVSWVMHDGVGYVFPTPQSVTARAAVQSGAWTDLATSNTSSTLVTGSVFSLQVNHGTAPSGGSYSYAILPGASGSSVAAYAAAPAVRVLANTRTLQAARHDGLALTQAAFYASGTLSTGSGATLTVREPSLVMLDESTAATKLSVSNPNGLATTIHADVARTRPESPDEFTRVTLRISGSDQGGATVSRTFDQPAVRTFTYQLRDGAAAVAPLVYQWSFEGFTTAERLQNSGTGANATLQAVAYGSEGSTAKIAYGLGVDETTTAMSPQRLGRLSANAGGALLTTSGTVAIPTAFTVEALVRPDLMESGGSIGYAVMAGGAATNNRGYFVVNQEGAATDSTSTIIGDSLSQADNVGRTIAAFVPGHWYYVANTYTVSGSQTTINSYVADLTAGQMSVTQAVANQVASGRPLTAAQMAIGGYFASGTAQEAWSGSIDEVSLFGRVLTAAEVQGRLDKLYQAPTQVSWSAAASGTALGGSGTWSALGKRWVSGTTRLLPVGTAQLVFGGSAGTVAVTGSQAVGSGMTFTTDGYTLTGGTLSFTGDQAANTVNVLSGGSATLAATISGAGGMTKTGAGTLTLAAGNAFSGDTKVAAGVLRLGHAAALGMSTFDTQSGTVGGFSFGALTTATFGGLSGSNGLVLTNAATTPAGVTLAVGGNDRSTTFPGAISGLGGLVKIGVGTLTLTGTNTYAGPTTIADGILTITSTAALPGYASVGRISVASVGTLAVTNAVADAAVASILGAGNLAPGATFGFDTAAGNRTYPSALSGSFGVVKLGTNTLTLSGSQSYTGPTTISGGTLAFTFARNQTLAGPITGPGALSKSGSGALVLTASNSHAGGTLITGGTLQIGSGGTTGWISGAISNDGALAFNRSDDIVFSDGISGSGSVVQAGGGELTLSGSNAYAGGTLITGTGSLAVAAAAALGSGTITLRTDQASFNPVLTLTSGMTLPNPIVLAQTATNRNNIRTAGATTLGGPITITGTGIGSNVFQNDASGHLTIAGNLSAPASYSGALSFRYGRILITGTINAPSATFNLNNGGTTVVSSTGNRWASVSFSGAATDNLLQLGADNALAADAEVAFNPDSSGGGIDMNGFNQTLPGFYNATGTSLAPLNRISNEGGGAATLTLAGLTANRWSNIALADGTSGGTLALVMNSAGRMQTLASATSSYTGGTTIVAGTIAIGHANALGGGPLAMNGGALDLAGFSPAVGTLSGSSGGLITSGSAGASALLTVSSAANSTFAGQIQNGAGTVGLVKSGTGTLTLTGTSTYTGATTVSAGTLALSGGANRLPTATTLAFTGGTVAMNGVAQTVARLSVANETAAAIVGTGTALSTITTTAAIVLGGSSISTLLLQPLSEGAFAVSAAPGITINAGGELQLGVYGFTTGTFTNPNTNVGASGTGTPVTVSGGSLTLTPMRTNAGQATVGSANAAYNRVGALTMSSGRIAMSQAVNPDRRLGVYGPLTITGGTVTSSGGGGTIELFSYTNVVSPAAMTPGIAVSQFMPTTGTTASLTAGVPLAGGLAVRSGAGTLTLVSTVAGENVGLIQLGDNSAVPGAGTTLKLGSNLGLIANAAFPTVHTLNNAPEAGGRIDLGIDTNGYTFDLTGNAGQWQPSTTGTLQTFWHVSSTSGTGRLVANGFNFVLSTATSAAHMNVGANVILEAKAGSGVASNLGSGTFSPSSVFRYSGSASGTTPATLTAAAAIGDLEVTGSGSLKVLAIGGVRAVRVSDGVLDLGGNSLSVTLGSFDGGTVQSGTLSSGSAAFDAKAGAISATLAGAAGLTKTTAAMLRLAGNNTYTGPTLVSAGTLAIFGNQSAATGAVTVASGATLGGTGTIGGATTIQPGATLSPGASPGTLSFTQSLTWNGGGNYNWQVLDAGGTAGAAGGWDLASVAGTLTIASTSADPFRLNLWSLSGISPDVSGSAANFDPTRSATWRIANATGGITGFSADKFRITTAATNGTGGFANDTARGTFSLALSGSTGLDLVFTPVTTLTWHGDGVNPGGSGAWTTSGTNWFNGQDMGRWVPQATAVFSGTAGTVTVGGGVTVGAGMQFTTPGYAVSVASGTLVIASGSVAGSPALAVSAGGQVSLPADRREILNLAALAVDQATGGKLDIGAGRITVAPGGIAEADLRADLIAGRGTGSFSGTSGIMTTGPKASAGSTNPVVGYRVLASGTAIVAWAAAGDANIDGIVNSSDVTLINTARLYGKGTVGAAWSQGDFNYSGSVNSSDVQAMLSAQLYGKGSYLPVASGGMLAMALATGGTGSGLLWSDASLDGGVLPGFATVPEPGGLMLAGMGIVAAAWAARRHRNT